MKIGAIFDGNIFSLTPPKIEIADSFFATLSLLAFYLFCCISQFSCESSHFENTDGVKREHFFHFPPKNFHNKRKMLK